ncbi:hypothetical protein C8R46DRAFT_1042232 [Mycena filopes]|nr:hypothetical protein C8R46DRAFT_1042232 [Mycena filopes]
MSKFPDPSKQNAIDMAKARSATAINTADLRDFLHTGPAQWRRRAQIIDILSKDPLFNKSERCSSFATRKELYIRGQLLTNRTYELQEIHNWTAEDTNLALSVADEGYSIDAFDLSPIEYLLKLMNH